jgi:hypothetical protein
LYTCTQISRNIHPAADIISLSFGSAGGWSGGKEILDAVNKLVELKGAIIIAAAGNEGTVRNLSRKESFFLQ